MGVLKAKVAGNWLPIGVGLGAIVQSGEYTPELTNINPGSTGSNVGRFVFISAAGAAFGVMHTEGYVTLGGTGWSVTGSVRIGRPPGFTPLTAAEGFLGHVAFHDSGATVFEGIMRRDGDVYALNAAGTYLVRATLTSAIPMTWAAGDQVIWHHTAIGSYVP